MLLIAIASLFTAKKIAFYAVMISVIAISVAIYAIIKLKRELDPHHLASIFRQSRQVEAYINSQVDIKLKELNRKGNAPTINTDKIVDTVIEEVRRLQKLDEREKEEERRKSNCKVEERSVVVTPSDNKVQQEPETSETQAVQPANQKIVLYATAVNEADNNTFYEVSESPTKGESIFRLTEIQKGKCEFEVYEGASSLVLKESEYLNGACTIDKIGNSKVITTQKGLAELNVDGKWVVKIQAKVKFE